MAAKPEADKPTRRKRAEGIIRPYRPEDRDAVREICCRTAYRNKGSRSVFEDDELFADYWTRYYTDFEPDSSLVIEQEGEVIGYLLGCTDTRRFMRIMGFRIVPGIVVRAFWRAVTRRYKNPSTTRMLRWFLLHGLRETLPMPIDRYPAHYHCNILRKGSGRQYYTTLALRFIDRIEAIGVPGMHGFNEESGKDGFWARTGEPFRQPGSENYFVEGTSSFNKRVLGSDEPLRLLGFGGDLPAWREWLCMIRDKHGV